MAATNTAWDVSRKEEKKTTAITTSKRKPGPAFPEATFNEIFQSSAGGGAAAAAAFCVIFSTLDPGVSVLYKW